MKHPYLDWLGPRLSSLGIEVLRLDIGRVHAKLYLTYAGRTRFVTIPNSPSDRRGVRNCLADIKRELNWKPEPSPRPSRLKKSRPSVRERAPHAVAAPLPVTVGADPWAALAKWATDPENKHD